MTEKALKELKNESKIMASLHHPNILPLYGICTEPGHYCIVMPYMKVGSLYNVLHSSLELKWPLRWQIALGIAKGIYHLHSKSVLHRNLKSLNILLDDSMKAQITDFGLSIVRQETLTTSAGGSHQNGGTPQWMAPELFKGEKYTSKSDVYSYGIILWELLTRKLPYSALNMPMLIMLHVQQGKREKIPKECPSSFAALMKKCWSQRREDRLDMNKVIKALLNNEKEILQYKVS